MLLISVICYVEILCGANPMADNYISKMLAKQTPYEVAILDATIKIRKNSVYPPGNLTRMFANYLLQHEVIKDKIIADVGAGAFALGIVMAQHGAYLALGTDISDDAIACAHENIIINGVQDNAFVFQGQGVNPLEEQYQGKIDILLSGAPWDTISSFDFEQISEERKLLSRAFYDVEDQLLTSVFTQGFNLLAPHGKMFITACLNIMPRIEQLCLKYQVSYKIVDAQDLHNDGNIHYILEITLLKK